MPRILIAEDMPATREVLQIGLERAGFTVVPARDGLEALRLAGDAPVDLAILDIWMPGLDGLSVLRQWRAAGSRLPVILLTAHTTREEVERGRAAGADAFIIKPFRIAELAQAVRGLLGQGHADAGVALN